MIPRIIFLLASVAASVYLAACDGYNGQGGIVGGAPGSGPAPLSPAVISTSAEAAEAFSTVLQSKELLVTSTLLFRDLGFITQSQMVSAASGSGTGSCADYGSYAYQRTYNANGTYSVQFTFSLCRQNDFQFDGIYSATGTPSVLNGRLSSGLKILNFKNGYTTLIGSLLGGSVSFDMMGAGTVSNGAYAISASGTMSAYDYYTLGRHVMTFTGLSSGITTSTDPVANTLTSSFVANGQYSARKLSATTAITYSSFSVTAVRNLSTDIVDMNMQGRVAVNRTPNAGLEGAFDVTTATAVRIDEGVYPPVTVQGTVVTNATATAQYGGTNTIDVSAAGDTPLSFAKEFMLMKIADFYALEQQLPLVSGATGTASGSVMSLSALSSGTTASSLNCYTDVHVSYFMATAPTATIPDWYVHWASDLGTCVPQPNIPFEEATASTGVSTDLCDVGLDINGSAYDITSGGVEHFLAAALPTGYYILSINNYSCSAAEVTNVATVLVGDYLFGPFNCSYSASDVDGNTPGAWCRLADLRVNASGVVDVLTPDPALFPWHP